MKPSRAHPARPALNYPWLLATVAVIALLVSKGLDFRSEPKEPPFVGPPGEPVIGESFLLRAKVGATDIGNAFAVSVGDAAEAQVVLTAMHRFGPAGGLPQTPGVETVAASIPQLTLHRPGGTGLDGLTLRALPISPVATLGTRAEAGDIAGISAVGSGLTPARLATEFPAVGTAVWLAVPSGGGAAPARCICALVTMTDPAEGLIYFHPTADALTLAQANAHSGAPILDLRGQVLGIHLGAALDPRTGAPYGLAQASPKFLPHLEQALHGPAHDAMASTTQPEPK